MFYRLYKWCDKKYKKSHEVNPGSTESNGTSSNSDTIGNTDAVDFDNNASIGHSSDVEYGNTDSKSNIEPNGRTDILAFGKTEIVAYDTIVLNGNSVAEESEREKTIGPMRMITNGNSGVWASSGSHVRGSRSNSASVSIGNPWKRVILACCCNKKKRDTSAMKESSNTASIYCVTTANSKMSTKLETGQVLS